VTAAGRPGTAAGRPGTAPAAPAPPAPPDNAREGPLLLAARVGNPRQQNAVRETEGTSQPRGAEERGGPGDSGGPGGLEIVWALALDAR
jgi:hypothetical protein